jgi:hypothetical protein
MEIKDLIQNNNSNDKVINEIIDIEWKMFDKVKGIGGRASCQDDERTFYIMRYSNFCARSEKTNRSYLADLHEAERTERNLLMEKYAYMMEYSDPEYYHDVLEEKLPKVDQVKMGNIRKILDAEKEQNKAFAKKYPKLASRMRPVTDNENGETSLGTYSLGEYKTYSGETITLLLDDMRADHDMLTEQQTVTVRFYGYESIEDAEQKL